EALSSVADIKQWMPLSGTSTSWSATTDGTPVADGTGLGTGNALIVFRRHTKVAANGNDLVFIVSGTVDPVPNAKVSYLVGSVIQGSTTGTLVLPNFESDFGSTPTPVIPEINLKINSAAVVTNTRKLRAKWTPELAQDLAAYQNLDAEV